jgi:hypothetical protein
LRMPGLSKVPNAVNMDIDKEGNISGLSWVFKQKEIYLLHWKQ